MKKTKLVLATLILTMAMSSTAFAVGWTQEGDKWCYLESDGSKATNVWRKSGDDWFYLGGDGYTLDAEKDGQWKQNETGWWFENPDGTYPVSTWKEISGNHYYFDENGYMLSNTVTPDGYVVGGDGAWIVNAVVQTQNVSPTQPVNNTPAPAEVTLGMKNALKKAQLYLDIMSFSRSGLIDQLEFEGFSYSESVYAVDNCGADWNEQAAQKAKTYLEIMAFSRQGLIEQLEFEGFSHEQAVYGVEQNGY